MVSPKLSIKRCGFFGIVAVTQSFGQSSRYLRYYMLSFFDFNEYHKPHADLIKEENHNGQTA